MRRAIIAAAGLLAVGCQQPVFSTLQPSTPVRPPKVMSALLECGTSGLKLSCTIQASLDEQVWTSHVAGASWEWGDGTTGDTTGLQASHLYPNKGTWIYESRIKDDQGNETSIVSQVVFP